MWQSCVENQLETGLKGHALLEDWVSNESYSLPTFPFFIVAIDETFVSRLVGLENPTYLYYLYRKLSTYFWIDHESCSSPCNLLPLRMLGYLAFDVLN